MDANADEILVHRHRKRRSVSVAVVGENIVAIQAKQRNAAGILQPPVDAANVGLDDLVEEAIVPLGVGAPQGVELDPRRRQDLPGHAVGIVRRRTTEMRRGFGAQIVPNQRVIRLREKLLE